MILRSIAFCLTILLTNSVNAQTANVSDFTLDNGMKIVVIEDHRTPVVTHMVWYRVGSSDEPLGKSGIAHFLEHLMFVGTDDIPEGEFSRIIENLGGDDNAFTSHDYTAYFQRVAVEHLPLMMQMEADRMQDLILNEEAVAVERDVVLAERNQRTDSKPGSLFSEQRRAAQFMNHPYGIPIIGWRHEIEQLNLPDALAFYEQYYAPNNAILVVAGDVDPDEVLELSKEYYGPLSPSENISERVRPSEPPQISARRLEFSDPRISEPYIVRTYLAPNRESGNQHTAAALVILSELLGGENSLTSVLGKELEFNKSIAVSTGAFYDATTLDPDTFGVYVLPKPGVSLAEAETALDDVLDTFLETGPDPEQLERIKAQVRASQIYALDDQVGLANKYGASLAIGLTLDDISSWPQVLDSIRSEDVLAAARMVLDKNKSVTGWAEGQ